MTVKELRATVVSAGLTHVDCIGRATLRKRAIQALELLERKKQI